MCPRTSFPRRTGRSRPHSEDEGRFIALGPRISRVHFKDFKLDRRESKYSWKNLGEGDVDWPAVRQAFADVKYEGWVTTEISGGDAAYLKDVVARLDRIFAGEKPVVTPS